MAPDNRTVSQQTTPLLVMLFGYAGLALLAYAAFFVGMGSYGIINGNESLYVESAREMALSGQWAIPTLNDLPYLEKPPLFVWLLTAARQWFGASEWSARLVTSSSGLLLVLAMARYSVLLGIGQRGFTAAFVLTTCLGMDVMSRVAMPDLLLTLLFSLACLSHMAALRYDSLGHLRCAAMLLGASSLIKGPLSITLFLLIVLCQYALEPTSRTWLRTAARDRLTLLLLIMPLSLWLFAIETHQPGAAHHFIVNEHILRFLGLREPHDYYTGSIFYYVPRLFVFVFPWAGVLFFGWLSATRPVEPARHMTRRFLWLCVWVPFGFFSMSNAKANYYILVCLPAFALLTADYLPELLRKRRRGNLVLAIAVPIILFVAIWAYRMWEISTGRTAPLLPTRDGSGPLTIAVLVVLALGVLAFIQLGWRRAIVLCIGSLIVPVSFQFDHLVELGEPYMSARTIASRIRSIDAEAPVFLYQDYENLGSLPIYLEKSIPIIDSKSNDLYFGQHLLPGHPNFVTVEQVAARHESALIVVMQDRDDAYAHTRLGAQSDLLVEIGKARLYRLNAAPVN